MRSLPRLLTLALLILVASSAGAQLERASEVELRSYGSVKVLMARDSIRSFPGGVAYRTRYATSKDSTYQIGTLEIMSCRTGATAATNGRGLLTKETAALPFPLQWTEQENGAAAELRRHCGGGAPALRQPHLVGISVGTDRTADFIDLTSIRIAGDRRVVWRTQRKVKLAPRPDVDKYSAKHLDIVGREIVAGFDEKSNTVKVLSEVDCGANTIRSKGLIEYDATGKVVRQVGEQPARAVAPETNVDVVLNFLCGL